MGMAALATFGIRVTRVAKGGMAGGLIAVPVTEEGILGPGAAVTTHAIQVGRSHSRENEGQTEKNCESCDKALFHGSSCSL